jgi:hypothetical protein
VRVKEAQVLTQEEYFYVHMVNDPCKVKIFIKVPLRSLPKLMSAIELMLNQTQWIATAKSFKLPE